MQKELTQQTYIIEEMRKELEESNKKENELYE